MFLQALGVGHAEPWAVLTLMRSSRSAYQAARPIMEG